MNYCNKYHLSIVTAPTIEPISLDEGLVQCHANQGVEDDWFYDTITAVRQDAEVFERRAFIEQSLRISFDGLPSFPIMIPRPPLIELTSFSLFDVNNDETSIDLSNLLIDTYSQPGRVTLSHGYSLPGVTLRELNSVVIVYKAGYGSTASSVPKDIRQAMLLHLGYLYNCRTGEPESIADEYSNLLNRHRIWL
jgi:uncharacterized phiE125 gp8 family phage protein